MKHVLTILICCLLWFMFGSIISYQRFHVEEQPKWHRYDLAMTSEKTILECDGENVLEIHKNTTGKCFLVFSGFKMKKL